MSTSEPIIRSCRQCGKPQHGAIACEWALGWGSPQSTNTTTITVDHGFAITAALERIATALETLNQLLGERASS